MVRQALVLLDLDEAHHGDRRWNPLASLIKPGDQVLIKPNLVSELTQSGSGAECVVTHGAVVRAIADYAILAMQGRGRLILGDAPIPTSSLETVLQVSGLGAVIDFYRRHGVALTVKDFREVLKKRGAFKTWTHVSNPDGGSRLVDLGHFSSLSPMDGRHPHYRVTRHDPDAMARYHADGHHRYLVARSVLDADVVIGVAKMKTHSKAGVTGALKNSTGINARRECLPHYRSGAPTDGGDEYRAASPWRRCASRMLDCSRNCRVGIFKPALHSASAVCWSVAGLFGADTTREGAWSGNDTLWRTIIDVNRILLFADKDGRIRQEPQRKVLFLIDGIVAGEGNGPLAATPRPAGVIIAGFSAAAVDAVMATVMGFDWRRVPSIREGLRAGLSLGGSQSGDDVRVVSNRQALCGYLGEGHKMFEFAPADHWESLRS